MDLPPVPASFAPREDADGVDLRLRSVRPTSWRDLVRPVGKDLGIASALFAVAGLFPTDDGEPGPVWSLLTEGFTWRAAAVTALVFGGLVIGVVVSGWRHRPRHTDDDVHWRLSATGLAFGADGAEVRWHEVRDVYEGGVSIYVQGRSGPPTEVRLGGHPEEDRLALVARLRAHMESARVSDDTRRSAHAAVRALTDGGP